MSNDTKNYPEDSFEKMILFSKHNKFGDLHYCIDETQEVAKKYGAVCTPDFFGFNSKNKLQYRGRLEASQQNLILNSRKELLEAMLQIASTGEGPKNQVPSIGCSIKWKE